MRTPSPWIFALSAVFLFGTLASLAATFESLPVVDARADHRAGPRAGDVSVSLQPSIRILGATDDESAMTDEALDRFRDAGLALPDLEIVFDGPDPDMAACRGHHGLFQAQHDPWRVLVCSDLPFVVYHELAHAWELAALDDDDRSDYASRRGFEGWNPAGAEWDERAIEDAAYVIQQNLMAGRVGVNGPRWSELTAAYQVLTGRLSPVVSRG